MTAKERVMAARLIEKLKKQPDLVRQLGLTFGKSDEHNTSK